MTYQTTKHSWTAVVLLAATLLLVSTLAAPPARADNSHYYVDSQNGSDGNAGTSEGAAWQTLGRLQAQQLLPGDVVHLRRGSTWSGGLHIQQSGQPGNPITLQPYGEGDRPTITNPGDAGNLTNAIEVEGSWVVIEGLRVRDAQDTGIVLGPNAGNNIIRDVEATALGAGFKVRGQNNLITGNYIHDLHMVVNTPGGDDDYGAVGVWLYNGHNEVSHNRFERCIASSYDYGQDGGAIEWWGNADGNNVHHNWVQDSGGFIEVGGGSAHGAMVTYNVSVNNGLFAVFHLGGSFRSEISDFRVENNTVVEYAAGETAYGLVVFHEGTPGANTALLRNNLFDVSNYWRIATAGGFTSQYNLYHLATPDKTELGFATGEGDRLADAGLANRDGRDFHLAAESPARNAGANVGQGSDFEGKGVPSGGTADIGAFEFAE
ncbi:MAG: right-handed parallel beta-helix repeat-containing protein [Anaerolineae bacterium]